MNALDKAKDALKSTKNIVTKNIDKVKNVSKKVSDKRIWWEVSAYGIRTVSLVTPISIITTIQGDWLKTGLGFLGTIIAISLYIIYAKPIKRARELSPGTLPFAIFLILAALFYTTADTLFIIGTSGVGGSLLATPFHIKYLNSMKSSKTKEDSTLKLLDELADKIKKI